MGSFVAATAIDGSGNTSEFSAAVSNTSPSADLALVLFQSPNPTGTDTPNGGLVTYTIGVANGGPSNATAVTITDTLPTGVTFQGSTAPPGTISISGQTFTANIGALAANATTTFTITATLPTTTGSLTDTATVTGAQNDPNTSNNTASVITSVVTGVKLGVTGSSNPVTATVGQPETFTFVVTNSSTTNTATNAILTVPLPAGLTYKASSASQGTTAINSGATGFGATLGSLAPGASALVQLTVTPTTAGNLSLIGSTQADQPNVIPSISAVTVGANVVSASSTPIGGGGPAVTNLTRTGIHNQPTQFIITFDTPLTASTANDLANYKLVSAGRDKKFGTKDDVTIPISTVTYSSFNDTVTLTTKLIPINEELELTVRGTAPNGVTNTTGTLLDGANNGTSGTNFVSQFSGVGPGAINTSTAAVDSVLASGAVKVKKVRLHRVK